MSTLLEEDKISTWMKKVPDWEISDDTKEIYRPVEFNEYMEGVDFVNDVAEIAEDCGHHPDLELGWCKLTIRISTHSLGGLTENDFELAEKIDNLLD